MAFEEGDWTDATPKKSDVAAVKQHFWADDEGAHVATVDGDATSGPNVLIDSDSVDIRDGTDVLATFGTETSVYTTSGTELAHFGYAEGAAESGTATAPYYTFGTRNATWGIGNYSFAEGAGVAASSFGSHAEGHQSIASGQASHAEGQSTTASGNYSHTEGFHASATDVYAHAEGYYTTASNNGAHAEGNTSTASGYYSHAEGYGTKASGQYSHAEGVSSVASGYYSHAEGGSTTASGNNSHAQGRGTIATSSSQAAMGMYNVEDSAETYAVIVGNGTSGNARSNALTLDWDGNLEAAGNASAKGEKLVYEAGDTAAVDMDTAGFVTASATSVRFAIPLCKPVAEGVTVTLESPTFILRGIKGYSHGSAASTRVVPTDVACTLDGNAVTVWATFEVTTNATNNAPTGVDVEGTLVFG